LFENVPSGNPALNLVGRLTEWWSCISVPVVNTDDAFTAFESQFWR
jgi:hypothetical protein